MSRLAGAGGAAEGALMNDHTDPGQPGAGGDLGSNLRVHDREFTAIGWNVKGAAAFR